MQDRVPVAFDARLSGKGVRLKTRQIRVRSLTEKQERFCQELLTQPSKTDAYRVAYPTTTMARGTMSRKASALAANGVVATRIEELRGRAAAAAVLQAGYLIADAMREAGEALQFALRARQAGAAVRAVALRAKLAGLLVRRGEATVMLLEDSEVKELVAMRDELRRRVAA